MTPTTAILCLALGIWLYPAIVPAADTAQIVALTLYGECRGEPYQGKLAVASVVYCRAQGRTELLAAVCLAPRQFSCWNADRDVPVAPQPDSPEYHAWQECLRIAERMVAGTFRPTIRATHYHARRIERTPQWTAGRVPVAVVGAHVFYAIRSAR